jgi:aromatic ring-opening dioxygenase catalytic subunit (LigB family)
MIDFLNAIAPTLGHPDAILVVSAHWEEDVPTITSGAFPPLFYDYYGFPEESYHIQYPAPGHTALAKELFRLLKESGINAHMDEQRGFDHGVFVPLKIMYPDARYPCVQLSLVRGLDPATHIRIGKALARLRSQNVLVLGSGFSFHNLRGFFTPDQGAPDSRNDEFQQWLIDSCTAKNITEAEREEHLIGWKSVPHARYCHPREEHLLPLHVCYGLAGSPANLAFDGEILGKRSVALLW